jgi:hypothetical protein
MKFTLILASAALLTLGSCAKNYSCNCTTVTTYPEYDNGGTTVPESVSTTTSLKYVNGKKKDAESNCSDFGPEASYNMAPQSASSDSVSIVTTCTLGEKVKV